MLAVTEMPGSCLSENVADFPKVAATLVGLKFEKPETVASRASELVYRPVTMFGVSQNTGVRSSSKSPVIEAALPAASIRSSHLEPKSAEGSAECGRPSMPGFLSSFWIRRSHSAAVPREFFFRCWASRPRLVTDDLRGRLAPIGRCSGGSVVERPGGERPRRDGRISRLVAEYGSLVMSPVARWRGGNSIEVLGIRFPLVSG